MFQYELTSKFASALNKSQIVGILWSFFLEAKCIMETGQIPFVSTVCYCWKCLSVCERNLLNDIVIKKLFFDQLGQMRKEEKRISSAMRWFIHPQMNVRLICCVAYSNSTTNNVATSADDKNQMKVNVKIYDVHRRNECGCWIVFYRFSDDNDDDNANANANAYDKKSAKFLHISIRSSSNKTILLNIIISADRGGGNSSGCN